MLRYDSRPQRVLPSRPRPQKGTRYTQYMQQGYLRHIGFWPDASCLVLCAALRCVALPSRSALLGLDFPTRPSSAPVLNHLTSKSASSSSSRCSVQLFPRSTLLAPPYSLLSVMIAGLLEQQTSFVPSLPPSN